MGLIKTKEKIPKCMLRRGDTFFVHMCFSAPTAGFLFRGRRERERERERCGVREREGRGERESGKDSGAGVLKSKNIWQHPSTSLAYGNENWICTCVCACWCTCSHTCMLLGESVRASRCVTQSFRGERVNGCTVKRELSLLALRYNRRAAGAQQRLLYCSKTYLLIKFRASHIDLLFSSPSLGFY